MFRSLHFYSITTATILIILFSLLCIKTPLSTPTHFHKILYLDSNFTQTETNEIVSAAEEWADATDHVIEFDVVKLPSDAPLDVTNGIMVLKEPPMHPRVLFLEAISGSEHTILGFYNGRALIPNIELVDGRIDPSAFRMVVLHELGHSIGLPHNVNDYYTLMFPLIDYGSDHITSIDLANTCKIYHCSINE